MSRVIPPNVLVDRLQTALTQDELPIHAQKLGYRLLNRLESPVCVGIMGKDAVQNGMLANALIGCSVIPTGRTLPVVELSYGPSERTSFWEGQDVVATTDGIELEREIPENVTLIRVDLPNDALHHMNIFSAAIAGTSDMQKQRVSWAQDRADIVLWCSQSFEEDEQKIWSQMNEELKDNSYLVLANTEDSNRDGILTQTLQRLQNMAGEEFFGLFAISARSALHAHSEPNDAIWQASGVGALFQTLSKRVQSGRVADGNSVLFFLNKNGVSSDKPLREEVVVTPRKMDESNDVLSTAHKKLINGGQDLYLALRLMGTSATSDILQHCLDQSNQLAELFMMDTGSNAEEIQDEFWAVSDMLTLMRLEGDGTAAADAVAVLLQMKWDLAGRMAA